MLRACLYLLAMFQQLMPPGMCLCQAFQVGKGPTNQATAAASFLAPPVHSEPGPCRCCGSKYDRPDVAEHECHEAASPGTVPALPAPQPCCPGLAVDSHQGVFSTFDPADYMLAVLAYTPPDAGVSSIPIGPNAATVIPPLPATPLYVSHCTLLI